MRATLIFVFIKPNAFLLCLSVKKIIDEKRKKELKERNEKEKAMTGIRIGCIYDKEKMSRS